MGPTNQIERTRGVERHNTDGCIESDMDVMVVRENGIGARYQV